jgi:hypothetical protein
MWYTPRIVSRAVTEVNAPGGHHQQLLAFQKDSGITNSISVDGQIVMPVLWVNSPMPKLVENSFDGSVASVTFRFKTQRQASTVRYTVSRLECPA